jgi:hypothetical protein
LNWLQNEKNGIGANGQAMFCLSKFDVKCKTKNGAIFMFRENKVIHCTMKNQRGNQYSMAFFHKTYVLIHLRKLKGWWWLDQIDVLLTSSFGMLFPFIKKVPLWLNMYVLHMSTKVTSLGRYFLNINNNQAPKVHEIIFLFKKYLIIVWFKLIK